MQKILPLNNFSGQNSQNSGLLTHQFQQFHDKKVLLKDYSYFKQ